jgi:hypothetical protein
MEESNEQPDLPREETSAERAQRLTAKLSGLLKEEMAAYGGGDAFIRWVRGHDEEEDDAWAKYASRSKDPADEDPGVG